MVTNVLPPFLWFTVYTENGHFVFMSPLWGLRGNIQQHLPTSPLPPPSTLAAAPPDPQYRLALGAAMCPLRTIPLTSSNPSPVLLCPFASVGIKS